MDLDVWDRIITNERTKLKRWETFYYDSSFIKQIKYKRFFCCLLSALYRQIYLGVINN